MIEILKFFMTLVLKNMWIIKSQALRLSACVI